MGDQSHGEQGLGGDVVAVPVELAGPLAQVAGLDAPGQAFPRRAVADAGDGDDVVRRAAAVRVVHVPEQAGVVALGEHRHPTLAERGLELVFLGADDLVHLVDEQHHATSAVGGERGPCRGAEQLALPLVPQFEGIVHPRARRPHLGRDLAGEQAEQAVGIEDALHQRRPRVARANRTRVGSPLRCRGIAARPSRGAPATTRTPCPRRRCSRGACPRRATSCPPCTRPVRVRCLRRVPRPGRSRPSATRGAAPAPFR